MRTHFDFTLSQYNHDDRVKLQCYMFINTSSYECLSIFANKKPSLSLLFSHLLIQVEISPKGTLFEGAAGHFFKNGVLFLHNGSAPPGSLDARLEHGLRFDENGALSIMVHRFKGRNESKVRESFQSSNGFRCRDVRSYIASSAPFISRQTPRESYKLCSRFSLRLCPMVTVFLLFRALRRSPSRSFAIRTRLADLEDERNSSVRFETRRE